MYSVRAQDWGNAIASGVFGGWKSRKVKRAYRRLSESGKRFSIDVKGESSGD